MNIKKILIFIIVLSITSCTGGNGVSDEIKGAVFGLSEFRSLYKLPHEPKEWDTKAFKALDGEFNIKVSEKIENKDGSVTVKGSLQTEDEDRAGLIIMAMMFSAGKKLVKDPEGEIKRVIASVDKEIKKEKYKKKAKEGKFAITYVEKDGKEIVTKFEKLK